MTIKLTAHGSGKTFRVDPATIVSTKALMTLVKFEDSTARCVCESPSEIQDAIAKAGMQEQPAP